MGSKYNPLVVLTIGMLVVFTGLICIVLIVKLMTLICSVFTKKKNNDGNSAPQAEESQAREAVSMPRDERQRLVAAISAALGEMTGMENLKITSIKRIDAGASDAAASDRRRVVAAMSAAIAEASGMQSDSFKITSIKKV